MKVGSPPRRGGGHTEPVAAVATSGRLCALCGRCRACAAPSLPSWWWQCVPDATATGAGQGTRRRARQRSAGFASELDSYGQRLQQLPDASPRNCWMGMQMTHTADSRWPRKFATAAGDSAVNEIRKFARKSKQPANARLAAGATEFARTLLT